MEKITLGVAAVEQSEWPPYGKQRFFFEEMVNTTPELAVNYFFFSPFDLKNIDDKIAGWEYKNGNWNKAIQKMPLNIYDRSFSSNQEGKERLISFRNLIKEANFHVLNPVDFGFLLDDKRNFHQYLLHNKIPTLETFESDLLSDTELFYDVDSFYLKPNQGSGGIGIYVIEKNEKGFSLSNNTNSNVQYFDSQGDIYIFLKNKINLSEYFLQKKAEVVKLNNSPVDLRVLIQNHGYNNYRITGQALRVGQENSKVSNLQSGGKAVAFEDVIDLISAQLSTNKEKLTQEISEIVLKCCAFLHRDFGNFFETGIDLLLTKNGPIILEANTRPSRWVFTMIADADLSKSATYKTIRNESVRMPAKYTMMNHFSNF